MSSVKIEAIQPANSAMNAIHVPNQGLPTTSSSQRTGRIEDFSMVNCGVWSWTGELAMKLAYFANPQEHQPGLRWV